MVLAWSYEITPGGIVLDEGDQSGVAMPRARRAIAPVTRGGCLADGGRDGRCVVALHRDAGHAGHGPPEPGPRSVAVLPLVDMSPAGGNAYLGDGLSEELSARLAQIPGLRVAARTSAFEFKGRNIDVRRIGEALGVRHVLEGSVRRDGDNLRVTVQLIDAVTRLPRVGRELRPPGSDLISIQDDISGAIAPAAAHRAAPRRAQQMRMRPRLDDLRAFDPYLAGLAHAAAVGRR